ncbi:MAG: ABC transporter ATP-binding protein [Anaerolineae bacterium]|jgi:branched-chain amino acid transport system ATP-binding protein|nr:MAG: ABC transporter ATP-binding protein [Anaerolineae bacterium]
MKDCESGNSHADHLIVERVTKNFAGLRALDSVSLNLKRGEILGLIGPNGSGKTTLINVITGLLPLDSGRVFIGEVEITNKPPYEIARAGLGRTFQTIRLFRELTVMENVEVAAVSRGCSRKEAKRRALQAIEELGLEGWVGRLAGELPYGLERRVEIARAFALQPDFLLLDEPAAGLNEEESDELLNMLAPIPQRKGLGLLIVDHDMRLIMRLCHRLHVLSYGKTIGEGTPEEVRRIPQVIEAYLGKRAAGG